MPKTEKIFADNPIVSSVDLSIGTAPTPYLVQDGEAILIFGTVNSDLLQPELASEAVHPVNTVGKRVAAGFILADFRQASMARIANSSSLYWLALNRVNQSVQPLMRSRLLWGHARTGVHYVCVCGIMTNR